MQLIRGVCAKRYSVLKKNLATDYGLKIDKYPDTIDSAINDLNVHEANLPAHFKKGRNQSGFTFAQQTGSDKIVPGVNGKISDHIQWHKCKHMGHYANQCPSGDDTENESTSALRGKVSTNVLHQSHLTSDGHPLIHIQLATSSGILDPALILLDSQSTVHVFSNKEVLTNIWMHPEGQTL